jgi:hypothetical protein
MIKYNTNMETRPTSRLGQPDCLNSGNSSFYARRMGYEFLCSEFNWIKMNWIKLTFTKLWYCIGCGEKALQTTKYGPYVATIMLGLYVMFVNILLTNLLIAKFK